MAPPAASKIIAVHLNYESRAAQRGRVPAAPSYFLKPPSSLAGDGDPIVRPQGVELLTFEGEVALVIGRAARGVTPERALEHVGWYAPANDVGVYDLRWNDRGSNVLSKGHDGFTPVGPRVPAADVDPAGILLRTLVNGEVEQEDSTANLIFPFALLIADLSRFMTLEPGDIILTGTPAGSRPVEPGDVVAVELAGLSSVGNPIVEADGPIPSFGAQPRVSPETRAAALGVNAPRPVTLSPGAEAALRSVSTATLSVQIGRRGVRNTFLAGLRPTRPDLRLLGYAYTLRYVPLREDVRDADDAELNAQKAAIESIGPGEVLVIDARGEAGSGTIGDILAARALARGATGIVTDGGARDSPALGQLEIPAYFRAPHAAVLGLLHYPLESNVPIACAGTLVMPGDVIVGDAEGVIVVPAAMAEDVAWAALEQEEREAWALERVQAGESIRGVYPLGREREAEFEAWRAARAAALADAPRPGSREPASAPSRDGALDLVLGLPGAEALDRVQLVLAGGRLDRGRRRTRRDQLEQRAMLGHGGGAAVGDLHEDRAADRVEAAGDVAQEVDHGGVRAALVEDRVELLVEAPEAQRVHLLHGLDHAVVDLAQALDLDLGQERRCERGRVALDDREHRHLVVEGARIGGSDLRAGVRAVDHEALGLEAPDRLAHRQGRDAELLGQGVDDDAEPRAVAAAENPLARRRGTRAPVWSSRSACCRA